MRKRMMYHHAIYKTARNIGYNRGFWRKNGWFFILILLHNSRWHFEHNIHCTYTYDSADKTNTTLCTWINSRVARFWIYKLKQKHSIYCRNQMTTKTKIILKQWSRFWTLTSGNTVYSQHTGAINYIIYVVQRTYVYVVMYRCAYLCVFCTVSNRKHPGKVKR